MLIAVETAAWTPRERRLGLMLAALVVINACVLLRRAPNAEYAAWAFRPTPASFAWDTAKYIDLTHAIEPRMPVWGARTRIEVVPSS